ncbi:MAG: RagB/SusD family nutrient uptake outer membrane protein [Bacteroidales bacterium]|jgi:hypothetical protein|nr:RagB/SusD family nutrient uptake outer membrane protein [Bacteroidales bacterium]MCI2134770.1 RagB/SusD family nutrient uptake outer membrane protein [Bacteroidales bacterium]
MKNILKSMALAAVVLSMVSCEDFLTKVPETSLSPSNFFSSEKELDLWTTQEYTTLLDNATDYAEIRGDDFIGRSLSALQKGTRTNATAGLWTQSRWGYLRHINQFFENYENCKDAAVRAKYAGVEHFFRALFYFQMVSYYGDVPYYDHVVGSADQDALYHARDPRGYVMKKVLEDLDAAVSELPESWTEGVFRVNKYAALALKSRVALFEGSFRKYHGVADETYAEKDGSTTVLSAEWFLNEAAVAAEAVMASGKYKLYTTSTDSHWKAYRDYFQLESLAGNCETIFAKCYDVTLTIRHGLQFDYKNETYSATRRFVNHYLCSDGSPIQNRNGWETEQYYEQFQKRDPRMAQTLHAPGHFGYLDAARKGAVETTDFGRTLNGYRIIKGVANGDHENATTSTTDWAYIRYAEVLLNYAEAKAELGTLTQADLDKTIKLIRERAGMPSLTMPSAADALMKAYYPNASGTQLPAILEIRRERVVELFAEGFHQWDMIRWNEADAITPAGTKSDAAATIDPACATPGYKGIYIPALGEYDTDHDGKMDLLVYTGSMPAGVSSSIPASNRIQVGANSLTLSEGTKGYITRDSAEDYKWEKKDYLYPVPLSQIQSYPAGVLKQNEGWE